MIQLSPSILAADFTRLGESCAAVLRAGAQALHVDVMDGHFVPNLSLGVPVLEALAKHVPAVYDVHLMISEPLRYVPAFCAAGASWITFHVEAESPVRETLQAIRRAGCRAGLSLKPGTPPEAVFPYLDALDLVLVMSVEPGFGGQRFLPGTPEKIAAIRAEALRRGLPVELEVDGGIDAHTAPLCARAGADILVAGSAVFRAADPAAAVRALREACAAQEPVEDAAPDAASDVPDAAPANPPAGGFCH